MRYGFTIDPLDLDIANNVEIGGESRIKMSYDPVKELGQVSQTISDSGTYTASTPAVELDQVSGDDLQLRCRTGVRSSVDMVVTFNVTFADDTPGTAAATFAVPSYAKDQSSNLPTGLTVDLIGVGGGNTMKKIKSVQGLASVVGGARGNRFELLLLPKEYIEVGCKRNTGETLPIPKSLPIPCGLNGSAFTKFGRSDPGELNLEGLQFTYADGLSRFNGHKCSVMVEVYKDDRVLTERSVYGGFRAAVNTPRGDGDDEVVQQGTGNFETFCKFV